MIFIPEYIRTDELEDVLSSVDFANEISKSLENKPQYWKWFIIAIHNSLQGAIVCAISGTAGIGALEKKSQKEWLEYFEQSRNDPNVKAPKREKLAGFEELLKRSQKTDCMSYLGGIPLVLCQEEKRDILKLHRMLRNDFAHFTPKSWAIEGAGLPRMVLTALGMTEKLIFEHPACRMKLSEKQAALFRKQVMGIHQLFSD